MGGSETSRTPSVRFEVGKLAQVPLAPLRRLDVVDRQVEAVSPRTDSAPSEALDRLRARQIRRHDVHGPGAAEAQADAPTGSGTYLRSSIAVRTRRRVPSSTIGRLFRTRDVVVRLTPARAATSLIVATRPPTGTGSIRRLHCRRGSVAQPSYSRRIVGASFCYGCDMRTIIHQKRRTGRDVTEWLSVIDQFDQLVADRAVLEHLVDAAVGLTGRRACVLDALNGRLCVGDARGLRRSSSSRPATTHGSLRRSPRRAFEVERRGSSTSETPRSWPRASTTPAVASGRAGSIRARSRGVRSTSSWSSDCRPPRRSTACGCATSGRRAVGSTTPPSNSCSRCPMTDEAAAEAVRRAGLRPGRPLMALAARPQPGGSVGPEALAQTLSRSLEQAGLSSRSSVIGRSAAIVVEASGTDRRRSSARPSRT